MAAGLAKQCQVQVAYAIGVAQPMNITVNTYGTGVIEDGRLSALVREHFDLRPKGIIQMLDLLRRSIERRQLMDILDATSPNSAGSAPTKRKPCAQLQGFEIRLKRFTRTFSEVA